MRITARPLLAALAALVLVLAGCSATSPPISTLAGGASHIATSPPAVLVTGVSAPGLGVFPTAKAVREYWSGLPSTRLFNVPAGAAEFVSFKALPSPAAFGADLDAWALSGHQVFWTFYHEADVPGALSPAAYQAGWSSLLAVEAAHPHPSEHSVTILTAACFPRGNCAAYYVAKVDLLGFDEYNLKLQGQVLAYARAKGKRMIFGEVGNVLNGAPNTDAKALAYATTFWAAAKADGNVVDAMWWSQNTNSLIGKPKTTAFLAAQ
jgi:hypothetical protein